MTHRPNIAQAALILYIARFPGRVALRGTPITVTGSAISQAARAERYLQAFALKNNKSRP